MGCYDSVLVDCPCGVGELEFQTKVGRCLMRRFGGDAVPLALAADVSGEGATCDACGRRYWARVDAPRFVRVLVSDKRPRDLPDDEDAVLR